MLPVRWNVTMLWGNCWKCLVIYWCENTWIWHPNGMSQLSMHDVLKCTSVTREDYLLSLLCSLFVIEWQAVEEHLYFNPLPLSRSFFPPEPMSWRFWSKGEQGKRGRILRSFCAVSISNSQSKGLESEIPVHRAASSLWSLNACHPSLRSGQEHMSTMSENQWVHLALTANGVGFPALILALAPSLPFSFLHIVCLFIERDCG